MFHYERSIALIQFVDIDMVLANSVTIEANKLPYKAHVLLVDDEKLLCEGLRLALQEVGYQVTIAVCGQEALAHISSCSVDMVLLDVGLPDVDGFTLCAELRKQWNIPVIILSGASNVNDVLDGYHSGATDFVSKPFQLRSLIQHLETALQSRATTYATPNGDLHQNAVTGVCEMAYGQSNDSLHGVYNSQRHAQSVSMPVTMVSNRF